MQNVLLILVLGLISLLSSRSLARDLSCTKPNTVNGVPHKIQMPSLQQIEGSRLKSIPLGQVNESCGAKVLRDSQWVDIDDKLMSSDVIQTSAANCEFKAKLNSGAELRLAKNSRLEIDGIKNSESNSKSFFADLAMGAFRIFTRGPLNSEIRTPVLTIGIRGTAYRLQHHAKDFRHLSAIQVEEGVVLLTHRKTHRQVTLAKGERAQADAYTLIKE